MQAVSMNKYHTFAALFGGQVVQSQISDESIAHTLVLGPLNAATSLLDNCYRHLFCGKACLLPTWLMREQRLAQIQVPSPSLHGLFIGSALVIACKTLCLFSKRAELREGTRQQRSFFSNFRTQRHPLSKTSYPELHESASRTVNTLLAKEVLYRQMASS